MMPLYEYVPDGESCEFCQGKFEVMRKFDDAPLTECPQCGQPCHRVLSAFAVNTKGNILSNKNLGDKGFTRYEKAGDGYYEKTAGKGPDVIKK